MSRQYPAIADAGHAAVRPVSFVVVRYSGDHEHNFQRSECIRDPINQVVVVDNTSNLFHESLTLAIVAGIEQARHDLIALVHEDVWLPMHWQRRFEASLAALEAVDADWGMVGSVGWNAQDDITGHWSDPHGYSNTFEGGSAFERVERLDEQLLVFHRARLPAFDTRLPGIHHLGNDLALNLQRSGRRTYAIDAPTIHKFADAKGRAIQGTADSPKIVDRSSLTYLADRACCNEYLKAKYPELPIGDHVAPDTLPATPADAGPRQIDRPFILVGKGGGASRLLSAMAIEAGVFLGNEISASGDSMEMVIPVYQSVLEKLRKASSRTRTDTAHRLRAAAAKMIGKLPADARWGFKLPESVFLLPELREAFPDARFIHLLRDPLSTCLRRTHMTARLDNHIGRATLPAAYDHAGVERAAILTDSPGVHMARTTVHQLELVRQGLASVAPSHVLEVKVEQLMAHPAAEMRRFHAFAGTRSVGPLVSDQLDRARASQGSHPYAPETVQMIGRLVGPTRTRLDYP